VVNFGSCLQSTWPWN